MRKILLLLLPVTLILTSCDLFNNYGKKYKANDNNEVYYKGDDVTEADAKHLADYLLKTGYFDPKKGETVQLTKQDGKYHVRFVYNKDVYDKSKDQIATIFWFLQDQIADNVFNGSKVNISLTDDKLKDFETIDDVNKVVIDGSHKVYYKDNGVKEKDAKFIGDSLAATKFFDYTTGDIMLTKEKGNYTIRFLPNEQLQKEKGADYGTILENYKYIISKYILNGDDVDLIVLDAEYNEVKNVKEPSDQRKTLIDQMIAGTVNQQQEPTGYDQTQYQGQVQTNPNETPVDNQDNNQ